MRTYRKNERGVTLIELLVAGAILTIGLIPIVRVLMYGLQTSSRANKLTLATNLARDLSEEIRTQAFSEEFVYPDPQCVATDAYPRKPSIAQCFGTEAGENSATTAANGGRVSVFDDVDDYIGWCRGKECPGEPPLETFDGLQYDGTQGYPAYNGFTRRVRIHNLDIKYRNVSEFYADPFSSYTSRDGTQYIKRYDFDNWWGWLYRKSYQ